MGRRKQVRPRRSGVVSLEEKDGTSENPSETLGVEGVEEARNYAKFVDIDTSGWCSDDDLDIAQVIVTDSRFTHGLSDGICFQDSKYSFRLRLSTVEEADDRFRLGQWPVILCNAIFFELLQTCELEDNSDELVIFSDNFDDPDEGVSCLAHLVNQKILMIRPVDQIRVCDDVSTVTVRVEMLKSAFDGCESLLETSRQPWKKSIINAMTWLRPEVTTQRLVYGSDVSEITGIDAQVERGGSQPVSRNQSRFDATEFYEAIKPSKLEAELEDELPDLLPDLRPYQRRAAYWMVRREKGASDCSGERRDHNLSYRPFSVPVDFLNRNSRMFYNPFSGNISMHPISSSSYVCGGILADEMGLGKTVELLACIFAHRRPASKDSVIFDDEAEGTIDQKNNLKRPKRERIECICGAVSESPKYQGIWVQCDVCDAWQHADCVGYSPRRHSKSEENSKGAKL